MTSRPKAETRATTAWVLDQILKLLHPFMPFITEELWDRLVEVGVKRENLLCLSAWPVLTGLADAAADEEIGWLVNLVSEVRSVRSEMNVPAGAKTPLVMVGSEQGRACARRSLRGDHQATGADRCPFLCQGGAAGFGPNRARRNDGRRCRWRA